MGKNMLTFNVKFIKSYDEDSDLGFILEVDVEYPKRLHNLHYNFAFLQERIKIKNGSGLYAIFMVKVTMFRT